MNYYAVQVQTGKEEKIIETVQTTLAFRIEKQRFIFPILCFIILKLDFSDLFRRFSRKTHQFELLIFQPKILNILFACFVYLNKRMLIA